jgi:endonuclease/exonuclease/phosphatase (EEP) superfamily protein YafD
VPLLRLITLNALCRTRPMTAIVRAIRQADPDIVMLQEVLPGMAAALTEALRDYPHRAIYPGGRAQGSAVFSRIPIAFDEKFLLSPDGWYCQEIRVYWQGRPMVLFNVHLMSPLRLRPRKGGIRFDSTTRSSEMRGLIERIQSIKGCDVIVAGDFNMTDQSADYRAMHQHARDAFRETGRGFGFTYPANSSQAKQLVERIAPPFLRLDHVFYQGRLRARSARVGSNGDSDHYSLIVELESLRDERGPQDP